MAIAATVTFPSATRAVDASSPAVSDADAPMPAMAAADSGERGESFDDLMNSLLGAASPAAAVTDGAAGLPRPAPEATCADSADGEAPGTTDVLADLKVEAAGLPVPPIAETLPPAGKILPSATPESSADPVDDALPVLPQALAVDADPSADTPMLVPSLPEYDSETPGQAEGNAAVHAPPATLLHGAELRLPTDAPDIASADSARPVMSFAASAAPVSQAASSLAPVEPSARDMAAAAASADTPPRAEQATQPRADSPLPADARTGGAGQQPATQDGDAQGQARLQELLARLGASGDAARSTGDTFRSLLQGAEGGAPPNTGALTYAQAGAAGPAREPAGPSLPVHTPLHHPEWGDEVSQRIRWAIGNQVQSAELKINPPQLGPVEVRVSVDADRQMTVTLSSQHALVRETLTDSLPRLRDLMSEHGFSAVNVDVSQHSTPDGRQRPALAEADPAARAAADADAERETDAAAPSRLPVRGLVDLYA